MSDKAQPFPFITFALLDLGFSSSKFMRFGIAQSNQVVPILSAKFAPTAPHDIVEAFVDGPNSR
jgi:hypothetical protein